MTLRHKESRHNMDQVYDQCCKSQKITNADCRCFYANLKALEPVISTDNDMVKCFRAINNPP